MKDHKKNFPQNPQVRLINPTKTEVGKPSKQILDQIISTARSESGLNQWKSNTAVINWFKKIERKPTKRFIQLDVVNFYPSITEPLLKKALAWARQFIEITDLDEKVILKTKNCQFNPRETSIVY